MELKGVQLIYQLPRSVYTKKGTLSAEYGLEIAHLHRTCEVKSTKPVVYTHGIVIKILFLTSLRSFRPPGPVHVL